MILLRRTILLLTILGLNASAAAAQANAVDGARTAAAVRFIHLLEDGDYNAAAAMHSTAMPAADRTPASMAAFWQSFHAPGPLTSVMAESVTRQFGYVLIDLAVTFGRSGVLLRVALDRQGKVAGYYALPARIPPYVPPPYVDTLAFREIYLALDAGDITLPAILTMPRGRHPVPGIVMVHGSGPTDRDGSYGPNRPYRDIAWGLASRGIAVLRYDKRMLIAQPDSTRPYTVDEEIILDALTALDSLRGAQGVDVSRIFLLGHSLGGVLAPEIALRDGDVAGIMMLAATPRDLATVMIEQYEYLKGLSPDEGPPREDAIDTALRELARLRRREPPPTERVLGAHASYFYDLSARDPLATARTLGIPSFFLQGGRDYQVKSSDLELWRRGMRGIPQTRFKLYPGLNHNFAAGARRSTPREYSEPAYVAAEPILDIASFIALIGSR